MASNTPTRTAGLAQLETFIPKVGRAYANGRNYDLGAAQHTHVSTLSPYIRHRLITEPEVVTAALQAHGWPATEKFVQEVFWRGYFKGWLEQRPGVWAEYRDGLMIDHDQLDQDRSLHGTHQRAQNGATGIACFDHWVTELCETGYLHNHARMWFASIWIFTLGLPWRLGADFFYRHLIDGDAASNTLSWRWIAGLHTRGKAYQAEAWNIKKFTNGRFNPPDHQLANPITPLDAPLPDPHGLPDVIAPQFNLPSGLLITAEDCDPMSCLPDGLDLRRSLCILSAPLRSAQPTSDRVCAFENGALQDAAARIGLQHDTINAGQAAELAYWAERHGIKQIITPYIPQGPLRDWVNKAQPMLQAKGITIAQIIRPWDSAIWPHATAGFFKVKKKIPAILQTLGIDFKLREIQN
jgi:hypothetical protein